jgi:2-polyprenyl-6-methoxyphenol hydroxylase-like FAD-dependent oxidoreductase
LPSAREARERVSSLSGSWNAAELPHRVSQKYVEQVLRRHAEALENVSINYGWRVTGFHDSGDEVSLDAREVQGSSHRKVRCKYLIAGDAQLGTPKARD